MFFSLTCLIWYMRDSTPAMLHDLNSATTSAERKLSRINAAFFMNRFMKTNIIKKALSFIAAAFITTAANHAQAALTITNGDFQDLTGLTAQGGGWYNGVPTGWSSNTPALTYNVLDWNSGNFAANLQTLSTTSPFRPLYQSAGLLDSASIVSLSFDILHFVPGPNVGVGIFNTYNSSNYDDWAALALPSAAGFPDAGRFTLETTVPIEAGTYVGVAFWQGGGGAAGLDNVSIIPEPTTLDLILLPVKAGLYMVDNISKNIYTCGINPRKFNALHIVY